MYRETTWTRTAAIALVIVVCIGVTVGTVGTDDIAGFGVVAAVLGAVAAVACYSVGRYSSVSVSPTHLSVGRERVELSRLDRAYGVRPGDVLPDHVQSSLVHIMFSGQGSPRRWRAALRKEGVALLGGAWGTPVRYRILVVREVGDEGLLLAFASLHPDRTTDALTTALATCPAPAGP